ncbi:MAG: mechanosensitive ion channel [bacterium]|nr:mechanosensitive ion channel [bacterium]
MTLGAVLLLILVCVIANTIARRVIVRAVQRVAARSRTQWDDEMVRARVFSQLAHFVPALIVFFGVRAIPGLPETIDTLVQRVSVAAMIIIGAATLSALLRAVDGIYNRNPDNRERPIKGYLQLVRIVLFVFVGILVLASLMDRSPLLFLSGLGAISAVLLLVFKDTILSLVASIQIGANDMVRVGDWIEMPQFKADGDVVDVALHTVKVQNWDKTITTIPTHKLITDSFKNWRGMSETGARRIKRSLCLDAGSVRFLTDEEIERFSNFRLLRDYIAGKRSELAEANAEPGRDPSINADIRRMTNIGTLRAYVVSYLRNHPSINQDLTLIVRQLAPGPDGLPLEIYTFTDTTAWAAYEGIQADLFDHLLAIVPEFGLRVFQKPAGADVAALKS